jgi:Skp family chaperone for outer membrane proteins
MEVIRQFVFACGLAACLALPGVTVAQTPAGTAPAPVAPVRVGFVNMQEVLKVYPRYKALQDELKKKDAEFMGIVKKKQERANELQKEYATSTDPKRKDAIEAELRGIKLEIDTIASDAKKTLGKYFDEQVANIYLEFYGAVSEVAKTNGFDIVWRYTEDWTKDEYLKPENIVRRMAANPLFPMYYDRERYDVTYRVVSYLNAKYPAPANTGAGAATGSVQQTGATQPGSNR